MILSKQWSLHQTQGASDCLALAKDCHAIYTSIDDSLRRIANQAFFDKLYVTEADTVTGSRGCRTTSGSTPKSRPPHYADRRTETSVGLKPVMSAV